MAQFRFPSKHLLPFNESTKTVRNVILYMYKCYMNKKREIFEIIIVIIRLEAGKKGGKRCFLSCVYQRFRRRVHFSPRRFRVSTWIGANSFETCSKRAEEPWQGWSLRQFTAILLLRRAKSRRRQSCCLLGIFVWKGSTRIERIGCKNRSDLASLICVILEAIFLKGYYILSK